MNGPMLQTIWTVLCTVLVIFMQAGFAMAGTGFTRAKNAGHTTAMNMMILFISVLGYWAAGYAVQTGGRGFFFSGASVDGSIVASFLYQAVLVSIAATIPIGAMSERWTFKSFVVFGFFISIFLYPLYAGWVWGGGWLSQLGRQFALGHGVVDFAGSSVIHMTGGVAGLAGAIVLGPRAGKYRANGTPNAMPGHHIPMAITGCLILFFGWFGMNSGFALTGDGAHIAIIALNTLLAGVAAAFSAMCYMWLLYGKPDISLSANGLLGGLVAVSASCAFISPIEAVVIGVVAGVFCCMSVFFVERKLKVDDPVGAVSVHGTCGAWGMIATGLFYGGTSQLVAQVIGVAVNFIFVFGAMYLFFRVLDRIIPMRVSEEVEFEGLDQNEVAVTAYPDFSISKTRR